MSTRLDAPFPSADPEPLIKAPGIGGKTAERLEALGLKTVDDVLFWLPIRYEDRTRITPIKSLRAGDRALIAGTIHSMKTLPSNRMFSCVIRDGTAEITLRFFRYVPNLRRTFAKGMKLSCFGEARAGRSGALEMHHPSYKKLVNGEAPSLESSLTPVYRVGDGLKQANLRKLAGHALDTALPRARDLVPADYLRPLKLPPLTEAIRTLHRPPAGTAAEALLDRRHPAFHRLALEEMLAWQIKVRDVRAQARRQRAPVLATQGPLRQAFLNGLPFELTGGQRKAIAEIDRDLTRGAPMMRLLQGDVGCGKTVVIAAAVLAAVEAGKQAAVMAPTELLAEQHMRTISEWLNPLGIRTAWLAGSMPAAVRRNTIGMLATGAAEVVCGTHALFQDSVRYRQLGLVVMDEQHRFGVHHRLNLLRKGERKGDDEALPHQLVTTATPIPRSLAMTFYAGMDFSVIPDMPAGRQDVDTAVIAQDRRAKVIERLANACREGRQAYWVCPLIEESEEIRSEAVRTAHKELSEALPDVRVGFLHGQVSARDRERTMNDFLAGRIQVLVATTIIEVGVDVPNASLMIIDNAERMGLTQLHQLRGRVGRGAEKSYCVLLYRAPLNEVAEQRLRCLRNTNDGFEIAREDLRLRGPGEILSTRQTGLGDFRLANLVRDAHLVEPAQRLAERLAEEHPGRAAELTERWMRQEAEYAHV